MNLWAGIIDMNSAALKPQEIGVLRFRGTIQTDESEPYITDLDAQQHGEITGRCVTIDPGRRDLLYCVHESSSADIPRIYRYTKSCQDKMEKIKKYRRICKAVKPQEVQNAEATLVNSQSLIPQNFEEYLRNRTLFTELFQRHYTETITNHLTIHPLYQKLKLSKYIRRQKVNEDMVAKLKSKFGNDVIFVMDNYLAPNTRRNNPEVICHGLPKLFADFFLSLTNQNCKLTVQNISGVEELRERLWSRDLAACLNMIHIVRSLRLNGEIPERFQRAGAERRGPTRRRRFEENEERRVLLRTL
ncbi:hypothetical protein G6F16_007600 [Rhizopus arrhizus]|nr:hypothetical protein G6F21_006193 [Rhizopus arrhizus]KAG0801215.1 hypothetical protein G6F22_001465 [Rhizopus arrhizus]KAG0814836.1 hypothetical protein G6F20_004460 [Rhizopus arrhizus]KAG0832942.1 hypothetical protein G6F19_005956 [Rhizopus arrhizus]KAG0836981.1 hypothetical protein G6F18_005110 [Rhizopus arrhizus]